MKEGIFIAHIIDINIFLTNRSRYRYDLRCVNENLVYITGLWAVKLHRKWSQTIFESPLSIWYSPVGNETMETCIFIGSTILDRIGNFKEVIITIQKTLYAEIPPENIFLYNR